MINIRKGDSVLQTSEIHVIQNGVELTITAVYRKDKLLWQITVDTVNSCFAEGYWIDAQPWTDELCWKN